MQLSRRSFRVRNLFLPPLLLVLLSSCLPAGVPEHSAISSSRQANWRTDWNVEAVASDVVPADLVPVFSGLDRPVAIVSTGDGSGRLMIAEQTGRVMMITPGESESSPVADLSGLIACCGEQGLIGLEVDPRFGRNGLIYVHYTDIEGDTVVSRLPLIDGRADLADEQVLFTTPQPGTTHNGGQLAFGSDSRLYFSLGDGTYSPLPLRRAQNPETPYGSVLRLDPAAPEPAELIAYGLRNPWRFSFDQRTGDLWIADVGQSGFEEINHVPADQYGLNFGWPDFEGFDCMTSSSRCTDADYAFPLVAYDHSLGCSVTGGYVYRGSQLDELYGHYVYGDFCSGYIWSVDPDAGDFEPVLLFDSSVNISTFGEDEDGELYLGDYALGTIYRLVYRSAD